MGTKVKLYALQEVLETAGISRRTLAVYEELGFISAGREGDSALYGEEAVETVLRIQRLRRDLGINLAGIEVILDMRRKIEHLQQDLDEVMRFVSSDLRAELQGLLKERLEAAVPRKPRRTFGD